VLSAVAFLDRTNVSIAGGSIRDELQINNLRLGWVFSAFLLGYSAFQVPGGWLACRFGPRRVLTAGVLWWGVFSVLTVVVHPGWRYALPLLILVRFLLGAGEAVMYPSSNQFISQWIPVWERGRANGLIFAGVGAGAGLSIPILTWLIAHHGWRASFWFSAVVGIAMGVIWFLLARDMPEQHGLVSGEELAQIRSGRVLNEPADFGQSTLRIDRRSVAALTMSYFCFGYVAWIYFSWFFIYLAQARRLDLKTNAFFSMIPFLAMTVCCLAGGGISDWLAQRWNRRAGRCGLAGARTVHGEPHSRRRSGRAVSVPELLLVDQRRSRRRAGGRGLRLDEYGLPDRRSGDSVAYAVASRPVWMELRVCFRRGACRSGRVAVARR